MKTLKTTLALALLSFTCCGISLAQTATTTKDEVKAAARELKANANEAKDDAKAAAADVKQTTKDAKDDAKAAARDMKDDMMKTDHLMMKDGVMMVVKDGKPLPMEADVTLANGTMVMKDGNVMMKGSEKKMMLEEGDAITIDGKMMKHHTMKDCCVMKDGKMMMMKDGKMTPMTEDMTLADGTKCMANGECIMKDGTKMMMKDGDKLMMDGTMKHGMKKDNK